MYNIYIYTHTYIDLIHNYYSIPSPFFLGAAPCRAKRIMASFFCVIGEGDGPVTNPRCCGWKKEIQIPS